MALIEKTKGRRENQSPSGYTRIFGIAALGNLMSRVQGAVISAGNELEGLIWARAERIEDLDLFITESLHTTRPGVFVATKRQVKRSTIIKSRYEPDFLAFELTKRECYVIEVKDGDQFDTKKAAGEHTTLQAFATDISKALPFSTKIYICSFNSATREEVFHGLKGKFGMEEILTGRELCGLFGIDYDGIVRARTSDQQSNLEYFIQEILRIREIKEVIVRTLRQLKDL